MNPVDFQIPGACIVESRIAKKVLLEEAELSAADKRLIKDGIQEIQWSCAFKPETCGISAHVIDGLCYDEIHWINVILKNDHIQATHAARINEMLQRNVPYPLLVWIESPHEFALGGALKRVNLQSVEKRVVDEFILTPAFRQDDFRLIAALQNLNFPTCVAGCYDLKASYEKMIMPLIQLRCLLHSGELNDTGSKSVWKTKEIVEKLDALVAQISSLKVQLADETQIGLRVTLNMKIMALEKERRALIGEL